MSLGVISICTSFSASEKVRGETVGPTGGDVPNAGGAPGVFLLQPVLAAIATLINPNEVFARNSRRDRGIALLWQTLILLTISRYTTEGQAAGGACCGEWGV
jgi:hypothetical protein